MSLDEATVARIARLARIDVAQAELAPLAEELSGILGWIEQLDEVDTADARPMTSVVAMQRAWRDVHAGAKHISTNWDAVGTLYGRFTLGLEPEGGHF